MNTASSMISLGIDRHRDKGGRRTKSFARWCGSTISIATFSCLLQATTHILIKEQPCLTATTAHDAPWIWVQVAARLVAEPTINTNVRGEQYPLHWRRRPAVQRRTEMLSSQKVDDYEKNVRKIRREIEQHAPCKAAFEEVSLGGIWRTLFPRK